MFGIKRTLADKLFSDLVRLKANFQCERCFRQYEKGDARLHLSHFWSRRNRSVRFDEENAASLDFSCHRRFTENPSEHAEFFLKKLGQEKYDALCLRARTPQRVDEKMLAMGFKLELKRIREEKKKNIIGGR